MSQSPSGGDAPLAGGGSVQPSTLPRSIVVLLGAIGVVVLGAGIRGASDIVAQAMLALVLTIAVLPIGSWARRHGWPSWLATLAALIAAYAILAVLVFGTIICLVKLVAILPQYADNASNLTDQSNNWLSDRGLSVHSTSKALKDASPANVADLLADVLSAILGALGNLFLLVTLMFFFVTAVPGFAPRMAALTRMKPAIASSLGKFVHSTQRYLVVTALFGGIVAVLDTGALWLLAVPLPLVWGFFSFLTNFIPNIGFVIGVIPPALLALLDSGWEAMVAVILVYCLLNVTIQTFIQPRFVGSTVGLSTEVTYLSLVVWGFLLGALGALLAVPMTLLMRALFIDADERAAWVAPLIDTKVADDPVPEPEPNPAPEPAPGPDVPSTLIAGETTG